MMVLSALNRLKKLRIIRSHMDNLELCKANLESVILSLTEKYHPLLELVLSVPGIKTFSAIAILSEIGVDMSRVPNFKAALLLGWSYAAKQ